MRIKNGSECWLKERFFDNPDKNTLSMTTTYKCNEFLSEVDIALYDSVAKTNPELYRVIGAGEWGLGEGQFFKEWRSDLHIVKPFAIPKDWVKFRSMDWGMAKPYAVLWFAVDYDGNIYCYRELYGYGGKANVGTGETASQVGKKIAQLEKPEENVSYGVLDNACWARTGVTGETIAEAINNELYKAGLVTFGKSSKGRVEGANAIKERLIGNEMKDGSYKPALYFFENCVHAIRTIPMLGFDKYNPETYDTQGEDHCFVAGTLITTKRGDIPIEEVTTDDFVLTRKGFRKVLFAGLTKKNAEVVTVEFSNDKSLTGTKNHPVWVNEKKDFVPIEDLLEGNFVSFLSEDFTLIWVTKKFSVGKADVYNLTVDGEHEYFANGFLVHNCTDAVAYALMSRPFAPMRLKTVVRDRYTSEEKPTNWSI